MGGALSLLVPSSSSSSRQGSGSSSQGYASGHGSSSQGSAAGHGSGSQGSVAGHCSAASPNVSSDGGDSDEDNVVLIVAEDPDDPNVFPLPEPHESDSAHDAANGHDPDVASG